MNVPRHKAGDERDRQDQFDAVSEQKNTKEKPERHPKVSNAYEQSFFVVMAEGSPISGRARGIVDMSIFREPFHGHKESSYHPICSDQRCGGQRLNPSAIPTEQK